MSGGNRGPERTRPISVRRVATVTVVACWFVLTGCGAGDPDESRTGADPATTSPGEEPATSLTITLNPGEGEPVEEWTLTCDPVTGTHPEPESACATLDVLGPEAMAAVPEDRMCTQISDGPQTATISGTWKGAPVAAEFSRHNGCEIDRWDALADVLDEAG